MSRLAATGYQPCKTKENGALLVDLAWEARSGLWRQRIEEKRYSC